LWTGKGGEIFRKVAAKALTRYKDRLRQLTRRSRGRSIEQAVEDLRAYLPGWRGYLQVAQAPGIFRDLDEWAAPSPARATPQAVEMRPDDVPATSPTRRIAEHAQRIVGNSRSGWKNGAKTLNRVLTLSYFDRLGVPRFS